MGIVLGVDFNILSVVCTGRLRSVRNLEQTMHFSILLTAALVAICHAAPKSISWMNIQPSHRSDDIHLVYEPLEPFEQLWATFTEEHGETCF